MDAGLLLIRLPWAELIAMMVAVGCGLAMGADWGRGGRVIAPVPGLWAIAPLPIVVLLRLLAGQERALADRPLAAALAVVAGALFVVAAIAVAYATARPAYRAQRQTREAEERRTREAKAVEQRRKADAARAEARRQRELRQQAEARQTAIRAEYVRFCADRHANGPWDAETANYCAPFAAEQMAEMERQRRRISGYQWYAMTTGEAPFENYHGWLRDR
ncbi:MAG: hypothetical protein IT337_04095 [Thermomicrobiales bacterium]|nr:hypothetical protein [Thermomicrobiales bacterium]